MSGLSASLQHASHEEIGSEVADRPIHTLVIEDSEFDRRRILRLCAETGLNFVTQVIEGPDDLRAQLDAQKFDLILVDYRLNSSDGLAAVRRIHAHPAQIHATILMLTGESELSLAVSAMKAGCADFLDKSVLNANVLRRATLNALEKAHLHQDLMRARGLNDKLARLMRDFAQDTAHEMRPVLLGMMRQSRARLRTALTGQDAEAAELDAACRKLWALLDAMEDAPARILQPSQPITKQNPDI